MFNPKILKKLKTPKSVVRESEMESPKSVVRESEMKSPKSVVRESEMEDEEIKYSKPLHIGKKAMHHAMAAMSPEGEMEKEKMAMRESEKSMMPQSKIEIELMLNGAKKKKK